MIIVAALALLSCVLAQPAAKPNFVVLFVDDLGCAVGVFARVPP
jgi:hypothetical protein